MTQFIIVTNSAGGDANSATALERDSITGFLQGKGWHVWHWYEDLWLVKADSILSASELRKEIQKLIRPLTQIMVFAPGDNLTYNGLVPESALPWIKAHWY
jgi:hypothetical protein